jgi:hypothetical protein
LRKALREGTATELIDVSNPSTGRRFSFDRLLTIDLPQQKSFAVTETDIERFLQSTKGAPSFFVLSLLYPQLRYNEVVFHQDHIHPTAGFTEGSLRELGIPIEQWQEYWSLRDCVPNLQLMNGRQNLSKNATPLKDWLGRMSELEQASFAKDTRKILTPSYDFALPWLSCESGSHKGRSFADAPASARIVARTTPARP